MKKLAFGISLCSILVFTGCLEEGIRPSGEATTVIYEFSDFHTLNISNAFNVEVLYDSIDPHVSITVDLNLLSYIEVMQYDDELNIGLQQGIYAKGVPLLSATVYMGQNPTDINASGASRILISDPLRSNDLDVDLSGASRIDAEIHLTNLSVNLSGASTADFTGTSDLYLIESSGASTSRGYDLVVNQLVADLSGASTGLFMVNESIIAEASGASNIRYRGDAEVLRSDLSGGSNLIKVD